MASTGAGTKEKQSKALSIIDAVNAVNLISGGYQWVTSPSKNVSFQVNNPLKFLLKLATEHCGITYEQIRIWLIEFLTVTLPIIELGVKLALLTNIKKNVSCTTDPRIPAKFRKKHSLSDESISNRNGIYINVDAIDGFDKLSVSPLSNDGEQLYFGTKGISSVYQFARAYDFDAFLWFVIHKAKFPNATPIGTDDDLSSFFNAKYNSDNVEGKSLLGEVKVHFPFVEPIGDDQNKGSKILPGNTFVYEDRNNNDRGNIVSMCINMKIGQNMVSGKNVETLTQSSLDNIFASKPNLKLYNYIEQNEIVPVSDDWKSANWYVDPSTYLTKNSAGSFLSYKNDGVFSRNYAKERAICNLQYINDAIDPNDEKDVVSRKILFSILPKPYVHAPHKGEPLWRFQRFLFNEKGLPDKNGKYTIDKNIIDESPVPYEGETRYDIKNSGRQIVVEHSTGKYYIDGIEKENPLTQQFANKYLMECYPGLTIYEFNYDYVMSLHLFDPKVVATSLLNSLLNADFGINVNISHKKAIQQETIRQIIKNIIESDETETSDCYYTFSNDKYASLIKDAEERRMHIKTYGETTTQAYFSDIQNILSEYDESGTLEEKKEVLTRAINSASEIVSAGAENEGDRTHIKLNFITDLINNLLGVIVDALLSPKVLLLFLVNQKIMGADIKKFDIKDVLRALQDLIISIVRELISTICQEFLKFILEVLGPLRDLLVDLITQEKAKRYRDLIKSIIENCLIIPKFENPFGFTFDNTKIANVDYADIDKNEVAIDKPQSNDC